MLVTWREFVAVVNRSRSRKGNQIQWVEVRQFFGDKFNVDSDNKVLKKVISKLRCSYRRTMIKKSKYKKRCIDGDDIVISTAMFSDSDFTFNYTPSCSQNVNSDEEILISSSSSRKSKEFKNLKSEKARFERIQHIYDSICETADVENIDIVYILGNLVKMTKIKEIKELGNKLVELSENEKVEQEEQLLPVNTALNIYNLCDFGRSTYNQFRKTLLHNKVQIFPPWHRLRYQQKLITPTVLDLPAPHVGKFLPLMISLRNTLSRLLEMFTDETLDKLAASGEPNKLFLKFGVDGSGGHKIYDQANNVQTSSLILYVYCVLKIVCEGETVWEEARPNRACNQRPLALQLGKETVEALKLIDVFNEDIEKIQEEFLVEVKGRSIIFKAECPAGSFDRKAANLLLGCGGAYCDVCTYSKLDCRNREVIQNGIPMNRDIHESRSIFDELQTTNGTIRKSPDDYSTRKGITTRLLLMGNMHSIQILHSGLRIFDLWMNKLIVASKCSPLNNISYDVAKAQLQRRILEETSIRWDFPNAGGGTSTTGKTVHRLLLHRETRESVIEDDDIPFGIQTNLKKFGENISVILRVINSKQKIDVTHFREFCTNTYIFFLEKFESVSVSNTLHKVLAHSPEMIERNDGFGLGSLDESGLEANHKIVRTIRTKLSRKTSQDSNLLDVFNRLHVGSDPQVVNVKTSTNSKCSNCGSDTHIKRRCFLLYNVNDNYEDELVESFFL